MCLGGVSSEGTLSGSCTLVRIGKACVGVDLGRDGAKDFGGVLARSDLEVDCVSLGVGWAKDGLVVA